jgi:hypothetical protein
LQIKGLLKDVFQAYVIDLHLFDVIFREFLTISHQPPLQMMIKKAWVASCEQKEAIQ